MRKKVGRVNTQKSGVKVRLTAYSTGNVILIPEGFTAEQAARVRGKIIRSGPPGISVATIGKDQDVILIEPKISEAVKKRNFLEVALEKVQVGVQWLEDTFGYVVDQEALRAQVMSARMR